MTGTGDVGEEQLGGVLGVHPDLLEVPPALEARHPALQHEQAHPRVALGRVGLDRGDDEVGVDPVGDEGLRAVHDVVVAVERRGRRHRREVGADPWLGHGDGGDELARADPREPSSLLLLVGEGEEVGEADVVVERPAETGGVHARPLDLLGDDDVVPEVAHAAAAEVLGHGHAEEALRTRLGEEVAVDDPRSLPLVVVRDELLGDEPPHRVAEQLVLVVEQRALHRPDGNAMALR